MKRTMVISTFPACGKTWLAKNMTTLPTGEEITVLELDSGRYDKSNPFWYNQYAVDVWHATGKYDFILVSMQDVFLEELHKLNVPFVTVGPNNTSWSDPIERQLVKQQWFGRFLLRDNSHIKDLDAWMQRLKEHYDEWTSEDGLTVHNPVTFFTLNQNQYLSDIISDLYWKKEHYDVYIP